MNRAHWLDLAAGLMNCPAAPVMEELPRAHLRAFARERGIAFTEDAAGNTLFKAYASPTAAAEEPPVVLVAHLDHPGFYIDSPVDNGKVILTFHGGVELSHAVAGAPLEFFARGSATPAGRGELIEASGEKNRLRRAVAKVTTGTAPAGGFAMWGFPGFGILDESIISARCCDDLLGAAAILCLFDDLSKGAPPAREIWGLFTRAEEIGFLGTLEAIALGSVPRDARVISLECSKAFAHAPQNGGVIVRVGDRASIFNPGLTATLVAAAETVARTDPSFKYQRKLMDGGACEATPFCAAGYAASGLALPLGNYHNQAEIRGACGIGPEQVAVNDFVHEVQLLIALARTPGIFAAAGDPPWVADLRETARRLLRAAGAEGSLGAT